MRPKKMPPDDHGAIASVRSKNLMPMLRPYSHIATSTPVKPAVERHPALPHGEDAERIGDQLLVRVDEHVTDAPADDRAERDVEHDVVDVLGFILLQGTFARTRSPIQHEQERGEIHDPVPAHLRAGRARMRCGSKSMCGYWNTSLFAPRSVNAGSGTDCESSSACNRAERVAARYGLRIAARELRSPIVCQCAIALNEETSPYLLQHAGQSGALAAVGRGGARGGEGSRQADLCSRWAIRRVTGVT